MYVSTFPEESVNLISAIPFPVSPCDPLTFTPVSTPSIYQFPFSPISITGVFPSSPGSP